MKEAYPSRLEQSSHVQNKTHGAIFGRGGLILKYLQNILKSQPHATKLFDVLILLEGIGNSHIPVEVRIF